jgi:foldase protein PrsA
VAKLFSCMFVLVLLLLPCVSANAQEAAAVPAGDEVVATINGEPITFNQLQGPLVRSYGLNILKHLAQLELVKQNARQMKVAASDDEIKAEFDQTLEKMFVDAEKADYPRLFEQFLQQQRITRGEFELVMETNAYLRKMAESLIADKISEQDIQDRYRATHGETIQVRHIEVSNLQEIAEAKRRLAAGEAFESVARQLSRNARTAEHGGLLPTFSRQANDVPAAFKDAAFAMNEGEISDPVLVDRSYHLIKLEKRLEPKAVKYEDVRDSVRAELEDLLLQAYMKQLRVEIGQQALATLKVEHPELKQQYEQALEQRDAQLRDRDQIRRELEKQREKIAKEQQLPVIKPGERPQTQPAEDAPAAPAVEE